MPAQSAAAATTTPELAALEKLIPELITRGFQVDMRTPEGKLPYLDVRNPRIQALAEKVYATADAYWFGWAEKIAGCDEVAKTAGIIARVLDAAANTTGE